MQTEKRPLRFCLLQLQKDTNWSNIQEDLRRKQRSNFTDLCQKRQTRPIGRVCLILGAWIGIAGLLRLPKMKRVIVPLVNIARMVGCFRFLAESIVRPGNGATLARHVQRTEALASHPFSPEIWIIYMSLLSLLHPTTGSSDPGPVTPAVVSR